MLFGGFRCKKLHSCAQREVATAAENHVERRSRDGAAGRSGSHLELTVLLLEVLVFVRIAVWKLVDLDAVLLNLLPDLQGNR